jgi:hypothetical protein
LTETSRFGCHPGGGPRVHRVDLGFLGSSRFRREDPKPFRYSALSDIRVNKTGRPVFTPNRSAARRRASLLNNDGAARE